MPQWTIPAVDEPLLLMHYKTDNLNMPVDVRISEQQGGVAVTTDTLQPSQPCGDNMPSVS